MKIPAFAMGLLAWAATMSIGWSQQLTPEQRLQNLLDSLRYQAVPVKIGGDLATLSLPDSLRYLDPADTKTVLVDLWGNPPSGAGGTLGMIVPNGVDFTSPSAWAVVITYQADGHVKDEDANKINYDELLASMQKSTREENKEREKQGYEPIELVGWAAPPKYDSEGKKLYWAQELAFGSSPDHTLNYNIRILGRQGVLVLNAVAAQKDLPVIEAATPELLAAVSFNPGNRYADFNSSTDKVAAYGIAALVAGGIAAKAGLFKGLWLAVLAFKKFIILGIAAVAGFVMKFFKKKPEA